MADLLSACCTALFGKRWSRSYRGPCLAVLMPGLGCAGLTICLATRAEGPCWWCDNVGPMHKMGLVSQKSSIISPMHSVSKDYVGLNRRNGSDNGTYIGNTEDVIAVDPAVEEEKLIILIICWEARYRYYA